MDIQKKGLSILLFLVLALTIPLSVQARIKSRINPEEIPDMEYPVYLYSGHRPSSLMAVFDIPDDDFRVFMYHTALVRRGTGRPSQYIEEFRRTIKGFKTAYKITDKGGQVRGYLMGSRFVRYQFLVSEDEIGVRVRDYSNRVENEGVPLRRKTNLLSGGGVRAPLAWLRNDRWEVSTARFRGWSDEVSPLRDDPRYLGFYLVSRTPIRSP